MHRRVVSLLATGALVASLGVLAAPGAAIAEDPPTPVPPEAVVPPVEPVLSPTSGPPGTVIAVTVPGCTGIVTAGIGTEVNGEAEIIAFTEGQGPTVQLTVPAGTPQGEVVVIAGCDAYDENDLAAAVFTVTAGAVVSTPQLTG